VVSGIAPPLVDGPEPSEHEEDPRRNRTSWLAAHGGEQALRPGVEQAARDIMALIAAGGPELPPDPHSPDGGAAGPPARDDAEAMARLRAMTGGSTTTWRSPGTGDSHSTGSRRR
jgi:hypothetical protein